MKFINKVFSVACLGAMALSCTDESTFPYDQDAILSNQGAFVRLDDVISGEFDLNDIPSSFFSVELEEWDAEGGNLLQDIELTVEFIDNTPGNGTNSVDAISIGSFAASSFANDAETGLPNIVLNVTAAEAMTALGGLSNADLDGGDVFRFEWTLNLTNGKSFNRNNQSGSLPGWPYYNSPFLLDVGVVCLLPAGFATGSYHMLQTEGATDPFFDEPYAFYEGDVVLAEGATSTERTFDFTWISFTSTMAFNLVCGKTEVSTNANPGASCGGTIEWFSGDGSGNGTFDGADDSTITIRFWDDYQGDCGLTEITELTLTKN